MKTVLTEGNDYDILLIIKLFAVYISLSLAPLKLVLKIS